MIADQMSFWAATLAVVLFITLSGFCLMLPVLSQGSLRHGVLHFYRARAQRILPAYWAANVCSLLLIVTLLGRPRGTMFDFSLHPTWQGIFGHLFLVNNLLPMPWSAQINPVFWSVALEWQIYFWFPVFLLLWRRIGAFWGMAAISLTAWAISDFCELRGTHRIDWTGFHADYYAYFAAGMLGATLAFSRGTPRFVGRLPWAWLTVAFSVGFAFLYVQLMRGSGHITPKQTSVYCVLMFVCLLVAASREGALQRALSWRPLVRVGEYSYSVYLLHLPLVALLTDYAVLPLRARGVSDGRLFVLLLALSLPLVLFVAYRFSLIFENKRVITQVLRRVSNRAAGVSAPQG